MRYHVKPLSWCNFCEDRTVMIRAIHFKFCPHGHHVVDSKGNVEVLQPRSQGQIQGKNRYRKGTSIGPFCNIKGEVIKK